MPKIIQKQKTVSLLRVRPHLWIVYGYSMDEAWIEHETDTRDISVIYIIDT